MAESGERKQTITQAVEAANAAMVVVTKFSEEGIRCVTDAGQANMG